MSKSVRCAACLLILFSVLFVPGKARSEQDVKTYILILADSTNLYPDPSTSSPPLRTVTKGTRLEYVGETKAGDMSWYQVQAGEGRTAYLPAEHGFKTTSGLAAVVTASSEEGAGADTVVITKTKVQIDEENKTIYTAADESSQTLGTAAKGLSFEVIEEIEGWYKIDFGGNPGWITRAGTSKIIEKETKASSKPDQTKLIVTWQKPDDNAPGVYSGYEVGSHVFSLYGSWKTWADSDLPMVEDRTDELSLANDLDLSVSGLVGYKWNRFVFGGEFGFAYGRFDIENFSSKPTFIVMHGGPRVRYFLLHNKWRPFADVMAGYSYTMVQSDSFEESYIYMDHYTLGMAAGLVYHKVSAIDFAFWAKSWDIGFMVRTDFFGPLKSKQLAKAEDMEVRAAYGWMPVGLYLVFGNQF